MSALPDKSLRGAARAVALAVTVVLSCPALAQHQIPREGLEPRAAVQ
jgi:hypothetical protein